MPSRIPAGESNKLGLGWYGLIRHHPRSEGQVDRMATLNLPRWVWFIIWLAVAVLVVIFVAWVVHLAGGGVLNLHIGHFVLKFGAT